MKPGHIVRFCKKLRRKGYPGYRLRVIGYHDGEDDCPEYFGVPGWYVLRECNGSKLWYSQPEHLIIVGGVR